MKIIVIATAAKSGGALTILKEFLEFVSNDYENKWTFVVSTTIKDSLKGFDVIARSDSGIVRRMFDELFMYRKIVKKYSFDLVVSLQNIPILGLVGVKQIVYVHQGLSFYPEHRWHFLSNNERMLWFYQNVYFNIIKVTSSLTKSKIIVQTQTMKKRVSAYIKRPCQVLCMQYHTNVISASNIATIALKKQPKIILICPGTNYVYKNLALLLRALGVIRKLNPVLYNCLELILTVDEADRPKNCPNVVRCIGFQKADAMVKLYNMSTVLLFPSYIETLGLPLVEAAMLGLPIIASDTDFAREVLIGYSGVTFLPVNDEYLWAKRIIDFADAKLIRYPKYHYLEHHSGEIKSVQDLVRFGKE